VTDVGPDGSSSTEPARPRDGPNFAHASEAEMARILDFYAVDWEYEPHTFPILWNLDGDVAESFTPDFWLPDLGIYLELTTLRQRLVRKKNRKLRRLRELYPDVRIKLFYARDFRALMLKYGKLALVDALSGTPGQVMPARAVVPFVAATSGDVAVSARSAVAEIASGSEPAPIGASEGTTIAPAGAARRRGRRSAGARREGHR
jgi:hypothetical protein